MSKKPGKTAAELMRELESDPRWVAARSEKEARLAARTEGLRAAEVPILADLSAAGVRVGSVFDLVGKATAPPGSWPVLVRHLEAGHPPRIREGLIRALGLPGARTLAFGPLCEAYRSELEPSIRWVIANTLAAMARFEEVAGLPGIGDHAQLFHVRSKSGGSPKID